MIYFFTAVSLLGTVISVAAFMATLKRVRRIDATVRYMFSRGRR